MLSDNIDIDFAKAVRPLQIVIIAMSVGVLAFLAVTIVLPANISSRLPNFPILTYLAIGLTLIQLIARKLILKVTLEKTLRALAQGTTPSISPKATPFSAKFLQENKEFGVLYVAFVKRTILGAALIEGPAFFSVAVYLIERNPVALVLAVLLALRVTYQMPSASKMKTWLRTQLARVEQLKNEGSGNTGV